MFRRNVRLSSQIFALCTLICIWALSASAFVYPLIRHVASTLQTESYLLLTVGVLLPPVGWLHGVYIILFG